jgi:hypothetical protein
MLTIKEAMKRVILACSFLILVKIFSSTVRPQHSVRIIPSRPALINKGVIYAFQVIANKSVSFGTTV